MALFTGVDRERLPILTQLVQVEAPVTSKVEELYGTELHTFAASFNDTVGALLRRAIEDNTQTELSTHLLKCWQELRAVAESVLLSIITDALINEDLALIRACVRVLNEDRPEYRSIGTYTEPDGKVVTIDLTNRSLVNKIYTDIALGGSDLPLYPPIKLRDVRFELLQQSLGAYSQGRKELREVLESLSRGVDPSEIARRCPICNNPYVVTRTDKVFCSLRCGNLDRVRERRKRLKQKTVTI